MNQNIPSSIVFLTECYHRQILSKEEKNDFYIIDKGSTAETKLRGILREHIPENWLMKSNVWIRHYHTNEVDILITTSKFLWAIECKNYSGLFEYIQGTCYMNQSPMHDEVTKVKNREGTLKNILKENNLSDVPVYSSMIFMNNECDVFIDNDPGFAMVMRYRLKRHIEEMVKKFKVLEQSFDVGQIVTVLERYRIQNPYPPKPLAIEAFSKIRKGVHCANCYSYSLKNRQKLVECNRCGHIESKKDAKFRTAAELGMVFYNDEKILTPANLNVFGGSLLPRNSIVRALHKVWPSYGMTKGTYYHNYGLPYVTIKDKLLNKVD